MKKSVFVITVTVLSIMLILSSVTFDYFLQEMIFFINKYHFFIKPYLWYSLASFAMMLCTVYCAILFFAFYKNKCFSYSELKEKRALKAKEKKQKKLAKLKEKAAKQQEAIAKMETPE